MTKRLSMQWIRNQRGIAMITVLFVGAALTVVASTAAFITVQEFQAGSDDRRAATALAAAEAGIDRVLEGIRNGQIDWGDIKLAGCSSTFPAIEIEGQMPPGSFTARLTIYNPDAPIPADRFPYAEAPNGPNGGACVPRLANTSIKGQHKFLIESTGTQPTATRVVRQELTIGALPIPIGIFANKITAQGTANATNISLFSKGSIEDGREKFAFSGLDPFWTLNHFWPGHYTDGTASAPAAIHVLGQINLKTTGGGEKFEHPPTLNCTANAGGGAGGGQGQSQFDQSAGGGPITTTTPCTGQTLPPPSTSKLDANFFDTYLKETDLSDQDYLMLRNTAKAEGMYCKFLANGTDTCTINTTAGVTTWAKNRTSAITQTDADQVITANRKFVAYLEYENAANAANQRVTWHANVWPCSEVPEQNTAVILIVRNGGLRLEQGAQINGAILIPEGKISTQGSPIINGTIIADEFDNTGTSTFQINECWVNNIPGPFLDVKPGRWTEVDR
jgi:Tfp pilus assembly protein PilX